MEKIKHVRENKACTGKFQSDILALMNPSVSGW